MMMIEDADADEKGNTTEDAEVHRNVENSPTVICI